MEGAQAARIDGLAMQPPRTAIVTVGARLEAALRHQAPAMHVDGRPPPNQTKCLTQESLESGYLLCADYDYYLWVSGIGWRLWKLWSV